MNKTPSHGHTWNSNRCILAVWLLSLSVLAAHASQLQLVSTPGALTPAGGNGDSVAPILSKDGRYVLFASTANNLSLNGNSIPIPSLVPARFNVYLRDRTSQTTTLVSINPSGTTGGNGDSFPAAISTNGQFVLFESSADNLVANDTNNATDIFLRDLMTGTTELVSVAAHGFPGNGASRTATMTPDGHYVVFVSEASNLVSDDTNRISDIFLRDVIDLATTRISDGAISTNLSLTAPGSGCDSPEITPDGRFIAFTSTATNLIPGLRSVGDIYVFDRLLDMTTWASIGMRPVLQTAMAKTNGTCYNIALSDDGKFVAYQANPLPLPSANARGIILRYGLDTGISDIIHTNVPVSIFTAEATRNLDMTPDGRLVAYTAVSNVTPTFSLTHISVWDSVSGLNTLVSASLSNTFVVGSVSTRPVIDPSGRYVSFLSNATNMVASGVAGGWHVYQRDLQAGTTMRVDADTNGNSGLVTELTVPSQSADGSHVAYESYDALLTPADNNRNLDVFIRDLSAGTNDLASAHHPALHSVTPNGPSLSSAFSASADGRYIAYASESDNLMAGDTNGFRDIFVRDLASNTNWLISHGLGGVGANGISWEPAISGDGRYVTFTSSSTNLAAGDTNRFSDVFVHDRFTGTTILASVKASGFGQGNNHSFQPVLSDNGRWLLFRSQATDLASGSFSGGTNLFLRDLLLGTNFALTTGGESAEAMTPSGRFIAFAGAVPGVATRYVYVWDTALAKVIFTNLTINAAALTISAPGNIVAFANSTELRVADLVAGTNWLVTSYTSTSRPVPRLSADGNWLAYSRRSAVWDEVYVHDIRQRITTLASHAVDSSADGGGHSDAPDISPNGRFVVYRTLATNIFPGANGFMQQVVLYDRHAGLNQLLSTSRSTGLPGDDHSTRPRFSADGQTLLFQSWASDLAANDFNRSGDVIAQTVLTAVILPPAAGQGPWLYWPFVPGNNYGVQFKNSLDDATWQTLPGVYTNIGVKAWQQDVSTTGTQRFYRIFAN